MQKILLILWYSLNIQLGFNTVLGCLLFMYISHQARDADKFVNLNENIFWYFTTESRFKLTNTFLFMTQDSGFYFQKDSAI